MENKKKKGVSRGGEAPFAAGGSRVVRGAAPDPPEANICFNQLEPTKNSQRPRNEAGGCFRLDLISLNKYVVTLIKAQAKSCLTYNSLFVATPLPFIEKILLLLRPSKSSNCRYNWCFHSIRELFFQKFVLSSIIRCLKI